MKIRAKLLGGIGIILLLMVVVGGIGWYGIGQINGQVDVITSELEIAKDVNQALADTSDVESQVLRMIIYKDKDFLQKAREKVNNVKDAAESAMERMESQANKDQAKEIEAAITAYDASNVRWWQLEEDKAAGGELRSDAAGKVLTAIKTMIDYEHSYIKRSARNGQVSLALLDNLNEAQQVRNSFNRVRIHAQKYQIAVTREQQDSVAKEWMAEIAVCDQQVAKLLGSFEEPEVITALNQIKSSLAAYTAQVMTFRNFNIAQSEAQEHQKEAAAKAIQASREVRDGVYAYIDGAKIAAAEVKSSMTSLIIGIAIFAVVIGLCIGLYLTGNITKGMNFVVNLLNGIAHKGHISTDVDRIYTRRRDEIGDLAKATELMLADYRGVGKMAQELADGNWTVEVKSKSEQDAMNQNLADMVRQVHETLSNVGQSATQIASGAGQVADSSQSLSQGATEQASSLEEISASLNQLASQTTTNAENANQANSLASDTRNAAQQGSQRMETMVGAMSEINEAGQNISKIIKTIDEIAFQTNLLALNAAVEAARAGQHGKGFAVVAEEVRNLAARSAKAAAETAELIEGSVEKTKNGSAIANQTAEALQEIVAGIGKASDLIAEIAAASSEQAQGVSQINEGVSQIDQVTQQNTAAAEEGAAAAEELSGQSEQMRQMLQRFTLNQGQQVQRSVKQVPSRASSDIGWAQMGKERQNAPVEKMQIALDDSEFGKY